MIDRAKLLTDLRRQLKLLEQDLAERAEEVPEMADALRTEYRGAREAQRTSETFAAWRLGELTQAGVSWLLGCVFVRFVEDNGLIDAPLIAGADERNTRAEDRQTLYFRDHPIDTYRDYLLNVFAEIADLPAMAQIYDRNHNPVWRYGISGDAARDLLTFWRSVDPDTGALRHSFTDPEWGTRFLGDLYQDLSDDAKKRFALLQTPEFVEEFILDRTLTPALDEFGLAGTRLIDPACGSGHFLLGALPRLLRGWFALEPGTPDRVLVQRALDGVYGVDINPFAVAIARFRLLVAALRECHVKRLKEAPAFEIHLAVGDSLLHGCRFSELNLGSGAEQLAGRLGTKHAFRAEDLDALNQILGQQYHAVVGNPPYVTVKDKAANQSYRSRYSTCHRQYSLAIPFTQRIFDLALSALRPTRVGYVGLITANSFMKREFGKKLIESFLPSVDLTHVIDTSGAYIPGHGTPTVILLGRNRAPVNHTIRTVMGLRGEPAIPDIPSKGLVWSAIAEQVAFARSESEWASVEDLARRAFSLHPWNIGGGAANALKSHLEAQPSAPLRDLIQDVGFCALTRENEAYLVSEHVLQRASIEPDFVRPTVAGDMIRDWGIFEPIGALWPYNKATLEHHGSNSTLRFLWRYRCQLSNRVAYGKSQTERGLAWYEYSMFFSYRYRVRLSIAFAFVATHNHFVLDCGGKVFIQSAPVIKLSEDATEQEHLALVGLLNSSVACFWMKQALHNKGGGGIGGGLASEEWEQFYEYTGTGLKRFPLPRKQPVSLPEAINCLAVERQSHLPSELASHFPITPAELDAHRERSIDLLARMISLQEELDWECYGLYGVIDTNCRYVDEADNSHEPPPLALGERAFEIEMARRMAGSGLETTWFTRHGSTPITELPAHWPDGYRALVERRMQLIKSDQFIGLVERPEYKRRWNLESWQNQEQRALQNWLRNRLESPDYWPERRLATASALAERAATDRDFQQVATRYVGHAGVDLGVLVAELVESQSVPALPVQRYKPSGLAKRADWERTWMLQRREDEIDTEVAAISPPREGETEKEHAARRQAEQRHRKQAEVGNLVPPPKYRSVDFLKPSYWRLRTALDVPKERFVSFPQMGRDLDPSLLLGWAGWDALSLAQAVAAYYTEVMEQDGWTAERLTPLLAVLLELLPWLKQWHNEIDPDYNQGLGDVFDTFLNSQLATHGLTEYDLRSWAPPKRIKRRMRRRGAAARPSAGATG